jgi:prevent-host-death family protein
MKTWQVQDAKAHFSKVVREATTHGPQKVTFRGEPVVVIISTKEYNKLKKQQSSFVDFIRESPLFGEELDLIRDKTPPREIEL